MQRERERMKAREVGGRPFAPAKRAKKYTLTTKCWLLCVFELIFAYHFQYKFCGLASMRIDSTKVPVETRRQTYCCSLATHAGRNAHRPIFFFLSFCRFHNPPEFCNHPLLSSTKTERKKNLPMHLGAGCDVEVALVSAMCWKSTFAEFLLTERWRF
jgi:hypothetical protein